MLNVLRENFKQGPYLKAVLVAVAAGLVLYLGSYFACDTAGAAAADWAARVNGREIKVRQFLSAAREMDQYYRQLFGTNYDQLRATLQLGQQAIESLIQQEIVLQDARRLGLSSAAAEVAEQIRTDPRFLDAAGQFIGTERYRQLVDRGVSGGVGAFELELADGLLAAKWRSLVTQSVTVPDADLVDAFRQRTVKTGVDYVLVPTSGQAVETHVGPAELQHWYDTHLDDYRQEAGFKVRYLVVDREAQRAKVEVSQEQIRDYYTANSSRYQHEEQRKARHILFGLQPDAVESDRLRARKSAEAALERLRNGEDFATLARALSADELSAQNGGELGFVGRGEMVKPLEEAVFSTAVGEFAPPTETPFGVHVIQVTEQRGAGLTPLEQVEESILRTLEVEAAQRLVESEAASVREQIGSAAKLQEVADRLGLAVTARSIRRDERLPDLGPSADFIPTLSTLEPGQISPPLRVAAGMGVVAVDELLEAATAPLDEVRDKVSAAILAERSRVAAIAAAERALESRGTLDAAAAALGIAVQSSGDLAPGQPLPGVDRPPAELGDRLFREDAKVGDRGVVPLESGAILYEITSRVPFDTARFEEQRAELRREILAQRRDQYLQAVLRQLRGSQKIEINREVLQQFTG